MTPVEETILLNQMAIMLALFNMGAPGSRTLQTRLEDTKMTIEHSEEVQRRRRIRTEQSETKEQSVERAAKDFN